MHCYTLQKLAVKVMGCTDEMNCCWSY